MDQGDKPVRGHRTDPSTNPPRDTPEDVSRLSDASGDTRPGEEEEPESMSSMMDLLNEYDEELRGPRSGQVVEGTIVSVDRDSIMVHIGTKSEGVIPAHEVMSLEQAGELPALGESVLVYVIQPENREGHAVLSLNRARAERGWRTVEQLGDEGGLVEATIVDVNRGGLVASVDGVRGFIPLSQTLVGRQEADTEDALIERLRERVGQSIWVKIIEVNRRRNRLILSERAASQERRSARKDQLIDELREGEVRHGRVTSLADFGAFVDIGGADGLVHISEMSWSPVGKPADVVKVGDEVDVVVLSVDRERKKIALSMRKLQPEPWSTVMAMLQPGDIVTGTITKITTFGAFARIEGGVEGLIHISELSSGHVTNPRTVVAEGEERKMKILRIEPERRRLGLSLRDVDQDEPAPSYYTTTTPDEPAPSNYTTRTPDEPAPPYYSTVTPDEPPDGTSSETEQDTESSADTDDSA